MRSNFNMKWRQLPSLQEELFLLVVFNMKQKLVINIIKEQRRINCIKKYNANGLCINSNGRDFILPRQFPWALDILMASLGGRSPQAMWAVSCQVQRIWDTSMCRKKLRESPTLCAQSEAINSPMSCLATVCAGSWRWTSLGQFFPSTSITTAQVALLVLHLSSLETLELSLESGISVYLYTTWRSFFIKCFKYHIQQIFVEFKDNCILSIPDLNKHY